MKASELKPEDYNSYYHRYILNLQDINLLATLEKDLESFIKFIEKITIEKWNFAYDERKWTTAEVLLHIIDTERVFQYRALCFSRNDKSLFPGFDQDDYVQQSNANRRSKESILNEFITVRKSTIALFESFDATTLRKRGVASNSTMSVGATGFIILGHARHHQRILEERYLIL